MDSSLPLGKYLASTDKEIRDKAIEKLSLFLSESENALPKSDMDKLWKGIFYCFWMSDKPLVQQALATQLADLLLTIRSTEVSLAFLRAFWECTVREWNGIDRLRIDKYYMLIRRFVNSSFRFLIRTEWSESACVEYNDILTRGGPLCPNDIRVPTSLAYHIADIYVEELDNALGSTIDPSPVPLAVLFDPFFSLAAQTPNPTTYKRVQSAVIEPLLSIVSSQPVSTGGSEPPSPKRRKLSGKTHLANNSCFASPEEGRVEGATLRRQVFQKLLDVSNETATRKSNQRRMYAYWKEHHDNQES